MKNSRSCSQFVATIKDHFRVMTSDGVGVRLLLLYCYFCKKKSFSRIFEGRFFHRLMITLRVREQKNFGTCTKWKKKIVFHIYSTIQSSHFASVQTVFDYFNNTIHGHDTSLVSCVRYEAVAYF